MPKAHLLALTILTLVALSPLFPKGFYTSADGENHLIRIARLKTLISEGVPYPRWDPQLNQGRGYPLFNFTYPLPYYLASAFSFVGFSVVDSLKISLVFFTILSIAGFYLWTRSPFASVVFLFTPYRFVNLYVRAALGETAFLGLLPLAFYFLARKKLALLSLVLWGLVLSHLQLSLIFMPIIFIYALTRNFGIKFLKSLLLSLIGSSFFWLPASYLAGYTKYFLVNQFPPLLHLPTLKQVIYSPWGFGFSRPGLSDDMSFQLGVAQWLVFILAIVFSKGLSRSGKAFLAIVAFAIVLITSNPLDIWSWSLLSPIQFPWRLLMIPLILIPFMLSQIKLPKLILIVLAILAIYANRNHIRINQPQFENTPDSYFSSSQSTATATPDEFMPREYTPATPYLFSSSGIIIFSTALSLLALPLLWIAYR